MSVVLPPILFVDDEKNMRVSLESVMLSEGMLSVPWNRRRKG